MATVESVIIIMLVTYGLIVTYLLYDQWKNQQMYLKDKVNFINNKTNELNIRERNLVAKEACERELIRLRTITKSALDILSSYNPTTPI